MMKQIHRIPNRRPRPSRRVHEIVNKCEIGKGPNSAVEENTQSHYVADDVGTIERYHELYDLAPIGFYNLDLVARITELNDKGANFRAVVEGVPVRLRPTIRDEAVHLP